jgi:phosphoserine phosphatase
MHLLTLIAPPAATLPLEEAATLAQHHATIQRSAWLAKPGTAPSSAYQLQLEVHSEAALRKALRHEALDHWHIDALLTPAAIRDAKLFISDMDSTVIEQECIDELADCLGLKAKVSAITARAMNGELDFAAALSERVGLLKGLSIQQMQQVLDTRITLMPGARTLLATLRTRGIYCVLVSGGFTFFTSAIRDRLSFHADEANTLLDNGGILTGEVQLPILGKEAKRAALHRHCTRLGIDPAHSIAIGDGANDLPMLLAAGLGIAYHAKPSVEAEAEHIIRYNDLSALLYVLSIPHAEWVMLA